MNPINRTLKRAFDIIASLLSIVILSPVFAILSTAILVDSGWPPLFTQTRVGLGGRVFKIVKFRTMVVNAERIGAGLYAEADDPRFTRLGLLLRRASLDELPQLWNILMGDESLVGPRPMVWDIASKLSAEQQRRHSVRPGLTGWAQVNGRNTLTWSQRVALDIWYIDHWSWWLDARILAKTVVVVLTSAGIRSDQLPGEVDDLAGGNTPHA